MFFGDTSNSSTNDAGAPAATAAPTPWYDQLIHLAEGALTVDQQQKLNSLNIQRASQGLPPIDSSQYASGVQVGLTSSTQNTILIGIGVLSLAYFLPKLLRS